MSKMEWTTPSAPVTPAPETTTSPLEDLASKYADLKMALDAVEKQLIAQAEKAGKTLDLGRVKVTYTSGRKTYDYETCGQKAPVAIIESCTEPKTDWKRVCVAAGLEAPVLKVSEPSIKVKVV